MGKTPKTKIRRKQVRKQRAESTASWSERFRARVGLWPAFMFVVFAVVAIAIGLYGRHSPDYSQGQKITQAIHARVDFEWVDELQTEQARQGARAAAPSFFKTSHKLISDISLGIQTLYQDAKAAETFEAFAEAVQPEGWAVDEALFGELRTLMDDEGSKAFAHWVEKLRGLLSNCHTFRPADARARQPEASGPTVRILSTGPKQPEGEQPEPIELEAVLLYPIENAEQMQRLARELAAEAGFPMPAVQPAIRGMLGQHLRAKPLLLYDKALTEEAMRTAAVEVKPVVISFKRGQPIVSPTQGGEDVVLTDQHLDMLEAEAGQYRALLAGDDPAARPLREQLYLERTGTAAIILLLSLLLFIHAGLYQRRILEVRMRTVAFVVLILGLLLTARLIDTRFQAKELALVPALVVAACLAIAYPRRFALGTTAIAALLMVQIIRGDMGLFVTLLAGLLMTVYLLYDIRSRTQIITAGVLTAIAVFVVTFAFGLIDRQALDYVARRAGLAAGSAVAAALVVQGILPFIERAFRIATSLTLAEWSLADKPLLQRLAREAPGTYNHSLASGTFAEAACEAIGANGLLVRVGALYHDIGKMHKADYFAENQEASISRHENLSASMSLLIILGHVKDGIELAREYGLPRVLYQFIEEHHGTTVVRYFHHKASEKQPQIASGKHDRKVPEAEFRYPGPKPRSKESAVLMLCDGVEGSVRALTEPTAGRIESVVHQIIMERLNDAQFGDCDITLKELQTVEDSLVKSLCTFYHGRVSYPKAPPSKDEAPRRDEGQVPQAPAAGQTDEPPSDQDEEHTQPEQRQPA